MKKKITPFFLLILSVHLLLAVTSLHSDTHWGDDFAAYLMQTISLVDGHLARYIEENTFTLSQTPWHIGPVLYPWGYPLLLAPIYALFGLNLWAFKSLGIVLYLLFLVCYYYMVRSKIEESDSIFLVAIFGFSPIMISFANYLVSDIPLLLFSTLTLYLIDRLIVQERKIIHPIVDMALLAFSISFAALVRYNGLLLLLPVIVCQVRKCIQRWDAYRELSPLQLFKYIFFYLSFLYFFTITILLNSTTREDYYSQLSKTTTILVSRNFHDYLFQLPTFFHSWASDSIQNHILLVFLLILFLVGVWRRAGREFHWLLFAVASFLLVVVWPYFQGLRFILPILPIFSYFCLQGFLFVLQRSCQILRTEKWAGGLKWVMYLACLLVLLLGSTRAAVHNLDKSRPTYAGPYDPYSAELFQFIADKTGAEDIIVFFKPRLMHLFTGRNSFATLECIDLAKADYLVMYKHTEMEQIPRDNLPACISTMPLQFIFKNWDFEVYQIVKQ